MTPEEVLEQAAEAIAEHGWHQGYLTSGDPTAPDHKDGNPERMCAVGAINYAATGSAFLWSTEDDPMLAPRARQLLRKRLGGACISIPSWNDAPERTAEDVILALKKAAHHE